MTAIEQPGMVRGMHQHFEPGAVALDAGCGTGRLTTELVSIGYESIGVDVTPQMLDVAQEAVPDADFRRGSFERLPVDDRSVDLIVSGLAVCHADDLTAVFAEFARVLRRGGHVVMSNPHPFTSGAGGQAFFPHAGAMPCAPRFVESDDGNRNEELKGRVGEIRVDYVQHALSAMIQYEAQLSASSDE